MEFDQFADDYQKAVDQAAGVSVEQLAAEKARMILSVLSNCVGNPKQLRVLDVGCGIGLIHKELNCGVAELWGIDTSLRSLELAHTKARYTRLVHYDGIHLPFGNASFDAVFASCVLHHVPPTERLTFMIEMIRPLRPKGAVILIEHNPINPVTQRTVSRCAFDADAVLLRSREAIRLIKAAGGAVAGKRYTGFSPFRNRAIERAERALGWLPIGAQYCVWGIKPLQSPE